MAHLDELNVNYDEAVAHDKEIVALKQELTKCSAFKASLYQDLRDEIISKEQFTRYREEFSAKEGELEQAIREQETIIRNIYEMELLWQRIWSSFVKVWRLEIWTVWHLFHLLTGF